MSEVLKEIIGSIGVIGMFLFVPFMFYRASISMWEERENMEEENKEETK